MNYKSKRWENVRQRVLRRDKYICRNCQLKGKTTPATLVHHVQPVETNPELSWATNNMISLCNPCHERMHVRHTHELTDTGKMWTQRVQRKAHSTKPDTEIN